MDNFNQLHYTEAVYQAPFFGDMSDGILTAISQVLDESDPVGIAVGYYDENLSICAFSRFFAENLGFSPERLEARCPEGLRGLICQTPKYAFSFEKFPKLTGKFRVYMQNRSGAPLLVSCSKAQARDAAGRPVWILSARMSRREQTLELIENIRTVAQWSMDYAPDGQVRLLSYDQSLLDLLEEPEGTVLHGAEELNRRIHPEDCVQVRERMRSFFHDAGRGLYSDEYRLRIHGGGYKWIQVSCQAIRRADGSVSRIAGIFLDVDKWKRTLQREQLQTAFHQAITGSNLGEYYVDLARNTYRCLKDCGTGVGGFDTEGDWDKLVQWVANHLMIPEDREKLLHACSRPTMVQRMKLYTGQQNTDCRVILRGEVRWHRLIVMPAGERENCAIVLIRDVTDAIRQAQANSDMTRKNQAMEQLITGLVNQIDRFAIIDFEKDSYEFFTQAEKLMVHPTGSYRELREQMTTFLKPIGTTKTLEELLSVEAARQDIKTPANVYKVELQHTETERIYQVSLVPTLWKDGTLIQALMVSADVTRVKKADAEARNAMLLAYQAADQANSAKSRFLRNMSHDLRTPLNAVLGMTALAKQELQDREKTAECLDRIQGAGELLLGMVNELLDMGRAESGELTLHPEAFSWKDLVNGVTDLYRQEIAAHGHSLEVHYENFSHSRAVGDRVRIQQVLSNLLTNAIKYTPDGGHIRMTVSEKTCTIPGMGNFSLTVEDNGLGMDESFRARAFDPFAREDSDRISAIPGTGLGLSIVKNLVNLMSGTVALESRRGEGTKITAFLSLELGDQAEAAPEEKPLCSLENLDCRGKTILLAEDNPLNRDILTALLEPTGASVQAARNGAEAFSWVRDHPGKTDLVLMDIQMPEMNGYESAAAIRGLQREDTKHLPIVAVTANAFASDVAQAFRAGMDGHLSKPVSLTDLAKILNQFLR